MFGESFESSAEVLRRSSKSQQQRWMSEHIAVRLYDDDGDERQRFKLNKRTQTKRIKLNDL